MKLLLHRFIVTKLHINAPPPFHCQQSPEIIDRLFWMQTGSAHKVCAGNWCLHWESGGGSFQAGHCKALVFLRECSRTLSWKHSVDTVLKKILSRLSPGGVIPQRLYRWDNLFKNLIQRQLLVLLCPNSWDKNMTSVLVLRIKKYSITINDHKVTLISVTGILLPFFLLSWFDSKKIEKKANCLLRLWGFPAETVSSPACLTNVRSVPSHWAPSRDRLLLGLMLFCCHLEILNDFEPDIHHFHFALHLPIYPAFAGGHKGILSTYSFVCMCIKIILKIMADQILKNKNN